MESKRNANGGWDTRGYAQITRTKRVRIFARGQTKRQAEERWQQKVEEYRLTGGDPPKDASGKRRTLLEFARYRWQPERRLEASTRRSKAVCVKNYFALLDADITAVTTARIATWLTAMEKAGYSPGTIQLAYRQLRACLRYAAKVGVIDRAPDMPPNRWPKRRPKALSVPQQRALMTAVDAFNDELLSTAVLLGLDAGLRPGEILALDWSEVHLGETPPYVLVTSTWEQAEQRRKPQTKGGKDRDVPLPARLVAGLKELGPRRSGRVVPWSTKQLRLGFGRLSEELEFAVTPHMLRHTFATNLLNRGVPITDVRDFLGHSTISITEMYLGTDRDRASRALAVLDALANPPDQGAP